MENTNSPCCISKFNMAAARGMVIQDSARQMEVLERMVDPAEMNDSQPA